MKSRIALFTVLLLFFIVTAVNANPSRVLITTAIDETELTTLVGNTRQEARVSGNDIGIVIPTMQFSHVVLELNRSPEQEAALATFMKQQLDRHSPNFHHWLTPAQLGELYGPSASDLATVSSWLTSHGFSVDSITPSQMRIMFSGTAAQIQTTFHTEMHNLSVRGEKHIANMSNPQIPVALAPLIKGVSSLNNFFPHAEFVPTYGSTGSLIVPGDLWTIYNFKPALNAGITGVGQTIVLIEDWDPPFPTDWSSFRSTFGLSGYSTGSYALVHPNGCQDPYTSGNYPPANGPQEVTLDPQMATAAAPGATIVEAACADGGGGDLNWGGFIAMEGLLATTPGNIWSVSWGGSEVSEGASVNALANSLYQEASVAGVSVFASAGDVGAAGYINPGGPNTTGITANDLASTPYDVAVGGTDYLDKYNSVIGTYWNSTNGTYYNSAKSYVPELPWNASCASTLLASYQGYSQTYGPSGYCLNGGPLTPLAGGGAPSNCATGTPSIANVASGTCTGYAKPSWQSVYSNPSDGVRDLPDVSMFASTGTWGHAYCYFYNYSSGGISGCTSGGGTSFGAPIWAGIQALINQKTGTSWGLPNAEYYSIAATEYGSGGDSACNSSLGNAVAGNCVFYDITQGDNDIACSAYEGGATFYDCYNP